MWVPACLRGKFQLGESATFGTSTLSECAAQGEVMEGQRFDHPAISYGTLGTSCGAVGVEKSSTGGLYVGASFSEGA